MSSLIESRGYIDRTLNINGMEPLAQGSTDPDGYGCERMHDETVLEKIVKWVGEKSLWVVAGSWYESTDAGSIFSVPGITFMIVKPATATLI